MSKNQTTFPSYVSVTPEQTQEQLQLLVEHSREILIIINSKGCVQYINKPILHTLGYLPEDLIARNDTIDLVHPNDQEIVCQKIQALTNGDETRSHFRARIKHQDNNWRTLEFEAFSQLDNPGCQGIILNARDITVEVEAQDRIEQLLGELQRSRREREAEKEELSKQIATQTAQLRGTNAELARALRTRDEFLANMSHELRTPLTSVLGQAELLREGIHGELNHGQDSSVGMIQLSGQNLLALINDILELVKIEAGRTELRMEPVGAETAVASSAQILQRQAQLKDITIELPSLDNQTYVLADGRRYHQILVNLLSNAIKFTPNGGRVGASIVQDEEQEAVHLTVWDEGIGIRAEDMKLLFQPFTQLDASLDRHHEGTGLGLALVYQLTEMQGGSISVESSVGRGSRFTVSLPQAEPETSAEQIAGAGIQGQPAQPKPSNQAEKPAALEIQPLSILLAEDNADNVDTIVQYLTFRGHDVLVATNGGEAVEIALENIPDVIIMDMQMPIVDGLEATRQLRMHHELIQIPVIALTGLAMPGDKENCLAAGANAYMSKPISLGKLDSLIHQVVVK